MITCRFAPKHLPVITVSRRWRDLLRKRYWLRCFECEMRMGPWRSREQAEIAGRRFVEGSP